MTGITCLALGAGLAEKELQAAWQSHSLCYTLSWLTMKKGC